MTSDSSQVYTLVLLPPAALQDELIVFSRDLSDSVPSEVVLGPMALPHATVIHWAGADLAALRDQLKFIADAKLGEVTFAGLTVVTGPDGDNWLEIPLLSKHWLREVQTRCLAATADNGSVANGVGENYRPHVTVGLSFDSQLSLPRLSPQLLRRTTSDWSLVLGISGEHYCLSEVVPWESR